MFMWSRWVELTTAKLSLPVHCTDRRKLNVQQLDTQDEVLVERACTRHTIRMLRQTCRELQNPCEPKLSNVSKQKGWAVAISSCQQMDGFTYLNCDYLTVHRSRDKYISLKVSSIIFWDRFVYTITEEMWLLFCVDARGICILMTDKLHILQYNWCFRHV